LFALEVIEFDDPYFLLIWDCVYPPLLPTCYGRVEALLRLVGVAKIVSTEELLLSLSVTVIYVESKLSDYPLADVNPLLTSFVFCKAQASAFVLIQPRILLDFH